MVTGEMKGYVIVDKFQSLNPLKIRLNKTIVENNTLVFQVALTNTSEHSVYTTHISEPCLALMQNKKEIIYTPLNSSSEKIKITPEETALIQLKVNKNKIDLDLPINIYTRTKENIRGQIIFFAAPSGILVP